MISPLRKSPLKRSGKPLKRTRIKKKPRSKSEFARIYHSKERVEFIKSLPCCACGIEGFSDNAHVAPPSKKGTGYKAGYIWIVPLCGTRTDVSNPAYLVWTMGCHGYSHQCGRDSFEEKYGINLKACAIETHNRWLEHSRSREAVK